MLSSWLCNTASPPKHMYKRSHAPSVSLKEQGVEDEQMRGDVLLAVQSIPFYVETCKLFVALVPQLQHNDLHTECNYCTWLNRCIGACFAMRCSMWWAVHPSETDSDRGWCRLEIWCNLLSHHNEAPFVVIQDCDHAELLGVYSGPNRTLGFS